MAGFDNAFVTGASSGIGRVLARLIASRGTRVVVAARREDELASLAAEIDQAGGRADVCVLDVTDTQAARDAIRHWDGETGGLDLVIANAGIGITRRADKLAWRHVEPVLKVNVLGAFATIVAAVPLMVARGSGTIVGISSLASQRGLPTSAAYSASKAALATFLETLRIDLAPKGVTVVDVRPGFVDTALTAKNRFKMPFLMDVDDAARAALRGIDRGQAIVAFPWQMATAMSVASRLPSVVYRTLAARGSPRGRRR